MRTIWQIWFVSAILAAAGAIVIQLHAHGFIGVRVAYASWMLGLGATVALFVVTALIVLDYDPFRDPEDVVAAELEGES